MRISLFTSAVLALAIVLLGAAGCDSKSPPEADFNLVFKYGFGAKNTLDTFKGTFSKDMVTDPPVTVPLSLSEEEMDRIRQKMIAIDFISYPENFSVSVPPGEPTRIVTPHQSDYFKVEYNGQVKELWWQDDITNKDEKADSLRELIKLIREIIEAKEEYKKLPAPTSGYL